MTNRYANEKLKCIIYRSQTQRNIKKTPLQDKPKQSSMDRGKNVQNKISLYKNASSHRTIVNKHRNSCKSSKLSHRKAFSKKSQDLKGTKIQNPIKEKVYTQLKSKKKERQNQQQYLQGFSQRISRLLPFAKDDQNPQKDPLTIQKQTYAPVKMIENHKKYQNNLKNIDNTDISKSKHFVSLHYQKKGQQKPYDCQKQLNSQRVIPKYRDLNILAFLRRNIQSKQTQVLSKDKKIAACKFVINPFSKVKNRKYRDLRQSEVLKQNYPLQQQEKLLEKLILEKNAHVERDTELRSNINWNNCYLPQTIGLTDLDEISQIRQKSFLHNQNSQIRSIESLQILNF